jgi:hypothetical protein
MCPGVASAAVLVGKAADGTSYRLAGKYVVVRLPKPVRAVDIRCGDVAGATPVRPAFAISIFADLVAARVRSRRAHRTLHAAFARDISPRVSACYLTAPGEYFEPEYGDRRAAQMRLTAGRPAGCTTGRTEEETAVAGAVRITLAFGRGGLAWRACRPGDARPVFLFSDGYGDMNPDVGPFALAGDIVAWAFYHEDRYRFWTLTVGARDIATGHTVGTIKADPAAMYGGATEVAVSASGILACIEHFTFRDHTATRVLARRTDGQVLTLDETPGASLSNLAVDGSTVSWLHDGEPRSASAG